MRPTIIVPSLTKEEFYESLRLAVLHCQDYLDEVDPNDVKVITKRNLFETLVTMYDIEKDNQLVELSEFARSAKEIDALKGFLTTPYDRLHLKYDKLPII